MHPQALEQWQGHEKRQESNGGSKKEMKLNKIAGKRGQKMWCGSSNIGKLEEQTPEEPKVVLKISTKLY